MYHCCIISHISSAGVVAAQHPRRQWHAEIGKVGGEVWLCVCANVLMETWLMLFCVFLALCCVVSIWVLCLLLLLLYCCCCRGIICTYLPDLFSFLPSFLTNFLLSFFTSFFPQFLDLRRIMKKSEILRRLRCYYRSCVSLMPCSHRRRWGFNSNSGPLWGFDSMPSKRFPGFSLCSNSPNKIS